jgi:hypothetical protein
MSKKKVWDRARALRKEVTELQDQARREGENDLADVIKRLDRELRHASYTDIEARSR